MKLKLDFLNQTDKYAPLILRVSLAFVFLYFGIRQLMMPQDFIYWLPKEAEMIPIQPEMLITLNGIFEVIFGSMLIIGLFRRISSFLLGMHLLAITATIGFTEIGVRDFGLAMATIVIAMIKEDRYSLDYRLRK
ncbi:MAG: DoxX family protein [Candidatus Woesearchaeota archaeon]|nr:DoxX family protein [Candidatus Woesearchaeota archaeon]